MCGLWRGTNAGAAAPDAGAAAAIGAGPGAEVPDAAVPFHPAPGVATARPRGSGEAGRGVRGREGAQGKRALQRTAGPHARPHRVCRSVGRRSPPGSYRLLSNDRGDMLTLQGSQGSALREATAQPSPQGDFRGPRPGPRPAPMEDPTATAQGPGPEAVREGTGCHPVTHDQTAAAPPGFTLGSRVQSTANQVRFLSETPVPAAGFDRGTGVRAWTKPWGQEGAQGEACRHSPGARRTAPRDTRSSCRPASPGSRPTPLECPPDSLPPRPHPALPMPLEFPQPLSSCPGRRFPPSHVWL